LNKGFDLKHFLNEAIMDDICRPVLKFHNSLSNIV